MEPGLLLAYVAMGVMAVLPIYYGSFASLKGMKAKKLPAKKEKGDAYATSSSEEEEAEALTKEDAYWFPIMGSCVLFGLYLVFKFVSKEYINYLLTAYFGLLGVAALTKMTTSIIKSVTGIRLHSFKVVMTKRAKVLFQLRFTYLHITMAIFSAIMSGYYVYTKNWIASNLFGLAFSVNAVQLLALDSFQTGTILLAGLFIYDIFWVFGTEVMVTVAKNFDAPIKVVWPKNLFADEPKFTMLGLGDIVIPGIFVALCLRFDHHIALARLRSKMPAGVIKTYKFPRPYFNSCFVAYILGLVTTVTVMHTFQAAQPALLYLSPACILASCGTALFRGEFKEFWAYTSEKADEDDKVKEVKSKGKSTSVQGTDAKKSAIQQRNVSVESSNDEASAAESPSLSKKGKSKSKSRSK